MLLELPVRVLKLLKLKGRDTLGLALGEPDFVTPKNIQDAAIASIENGKIVFIPWLPGLPETPRMQSQHLYGKFL